MTVVHFETDFDQPTLAASVPVKASTSCVTECVVSNRFGYAAQPSAVMASRFACRCRT